LFIRETIIYIKHSPERNNARMSILNMRREVIEDLRHKMA
jgi:hypothetical protein